MKKNELIKNILFAEDDPFLIDIYSLKLKESGFNVEIAKDGEECLAKLREKKPDILLIDIVLPQMSGLEVLKRIKKDPVLVDLKVIILSNLGEKREVEEGLSLGATKYLIKAHFTPSEVVKEILTLI